MNLLTTHRRTLLSVSALSITTIAALSLLAPRASSPLITKATMSTSSTSPTSYPTRPYHPRHTTWPYTSRDMAPQDPSSDHDFYSQPRFLTHIDDHAIATLSQYYSTFLPRTGRILDFCSSWISHFPPSLAEAANSGALEVAGAGMNIQEMNANKLLQGRWVVKDLNADPTLPSIPALFAGEMASPQASTGGGKAEEVLDASVCVVSIDYLTSPVRILQSVLANTKPGGTVHLVISNRCFPTKAVSRWLRIDEEERLDMVGDYLHFAGWQNIEILTLSDGKLEEEEGQAPATQQGGLAALMKMMGMAGGRCDPLWVVRARKGDASSTAGAIP